MNGLTKGLDLYDIDSAEITRQLLINDDFLMSLIGGEDKVFKFHVPEENREDPPIIRIHPISELPTEYADNEQLGWDCIVQIDVWDYSNARGLALEINKLMKTIDFQQTTPTFELDPDTYLIRDGRRYRGKILKDLQK